MSDSITNVSDFAIRQIKSDISNCRLKGLMTEPFIAAPAMNLVPIIGAVTPCGRNVDTAAVSGKRLYVNPDFWNSLIKKERIGLFIHEVWHVALGHHLRRGNRNPKLWNIACDYYINLLVIAAGFDLPKGGLLDPKYTGWSEERIYAYLDEHALHITVPSNSGQHMEPSNEQGQGGGSTVVIDNGDAVNGHGSDDDDSEDGSEQADEGSGSKDSDAEAGGDEAGGSDSGSGDTGTGDSDEVGDAAEGEGSESTGSGEDSDGTEEGDSSGAADDGPEESGGLDELGGDGSDGGDQPDGQRPDEPDAPDGEASVLSKHADAYEDVPWGEVWDAEDEDGQLLDENEKREELQSLKEDIQMAKNMNHKTAGNSSRLAATRAVENLVNPNTDWSHVLRMFFSRNGNPSGRSWHSLDRRGLQVGRYEPAVVKDSIDWMVCFWDVSISMDWPSHRALLSQMARIRKTCEIRRLTILPFNHVALTSEMVELKPHDPLPTRFNIGGGTRFDAPFNWLHHQPGNPDGVIVFTDLGSNVSVPRPKCDVLWMSSEPVYDQGQFPGYPDYCNRPPWGKVVEIKLH